MAIDITRPPKILLQNKRLNHLIHPNFQGANRLFVLSFEDKNVRKGHTVYYLPKVEAKIIMS